MEWQLSENSQKMSHPLYWALLYNIYCCNPLKFIFKTWFYSSMLSAAKFYRGHFGCHWFSLMFPTPVTGQNWRPVKIKTLFAFLSVKQLDTDIYAVSKNDLSNHPSAGEEMPKLQRWVYLIGIFAQFRVTTQLLRETFLK